MDSGLTTTQELELLSALETRGESPLKFAYIGEGYKNWVEIAEQSRANQSVQYEEDLLKKESLPFIFREVKEEVDTVNIIDFGCGDGVPMLPVFEYLQDKGTNVRYIPVDISSSMLEAAERTINDNFEDVEVVPIQFDFDKGEILEEILSLTRAEKTRNYFFLLGNTLGNFDNTEKVLANLKLSMFSRDSLIIGNQVSNLLAIQKLLQYYSTSTVFDFVSNTLRRYGMSCSEEEFNTRWNAQKRQVEMLLVLEEKKDVVIGEHTVHFDKGEEILLAVSKKFAEQDLVGVFTEVGFRIDLFTTNSKKDTCIAVITPTRYKTS